MNKGGTVFLAARMANDRGRRGGRAGAKSGKAGGRGRGSNQANPSPAPGREEDGGEGGRGGGTGGTRGGRGQARRGGRGGKRVAGSDAAAGTSPASKARKISHPNKKAKPGGEPKVLWSPGKAGGGGEAGTGSSIYRGAGAGGGGTGGNNLVTQNKLSSLASSFNERYGEVVGFDEEETEGRSRGETGAKAPQTARRKRSLSGGGGAAIAEEAARSMSPSKLAAEMQKARARAREERFGAGSAVNRSSSLARRTPPVVSISAQALPSAQAPVGKANGRAVHDGSRSVNLIPFTPSPPPEASAPSPRSPLPGSTAGVTAVTTASASASASGAVAGATRVAGANGFHRASLASPTAASGELPSVAPTPPTSAASALPIVTPLDIEEDEPSAARGSGRFVTVVDEVSPVETTANMLPSKRPAPGSGDVVAIEPPAKKAGTSSPSAAAAAATAAETQGDAAKVHTLRLRLRTDLSGGEQTRFGGVEESKSFEPPNSPVDGGVEECKGFDPPNLPRTQQQRQPTPLPSSTVSPPTVDLSAQEKLPRPPLASSVSSAAVAVGPPAPPPSPAPPSPVAGTSPTTSRSKSAEEVAPSLALSRESSWGPSFGIATATEPAAAAAAATALPKPVTGSVKNPWVLSPEAPTFAKNQGRPLARSFSQPTTDTDTAVTVSSGAGTDGNRGLGRDHGAVTGPGVVRPVVGSSSGGGGRGEGGASGHDRRPTSRPAATSRVAPPPSPAFPAAPAAAASAGAATRGGGAANRGGGAAAAPAPAAAPTASVCVSSGNEPSALRVTQDVLPIAESSIRSSGGQAGVSCREATCTEGERGVAAVAEGGSAPDAQPEESVLGLRVGGRAGELLERLRREREESLDFERKLTQALLDL